MQTRRDQLHAYRFLTKRALAALVTGQPNAVEPPMRRLTVTTLSGVMIAVLVAAGFALFGFLKPSAGKSWQSQGTIVVERETGARYVYLGGLLDPVLNYSSGVLAVSGNGQQQAHVTLVDRSEIAGVKRGPTIGIDGIPDSLPSASSLISSPWTVCSRQRAGNPTRLQATVSVLVGSTASSTLLSGDAGVIVRSASGGDRFLLWHGQRLDIGSDDVATLLDLQSTTPLTVGTAFLNAVPPGPALRTPIVPDLGASGPSLDGKPTTVGQLITATDSRQEFVVLAGGIEPVTAVGAALLRSVTLPTGQHLDVRSSTEGAILDVHQTTDAGLARQFDGLPSTVPSVSGTPAQNGGVCAVYRGNLTHPRFAVPPSQLPSYQLTDIVESRTSQRGTADSVLVDPGHAAIVHSADGSPTVFVITEPGRKYAFATQALLTAFGYGKATPTALPGQLLPLVPTGPALDPTAARRPVVH